MVIFNKSDFCPQFFCVFLNLVTGLLLRGFTLVEGFLIEGVSKNTREKTELSSRVVVLLFHSNFATHASQEDSVLLGFFPGSAIIPSK